MVGAIAGAIPNTIPIMVIARASAMPTKRSRMMARAITTPPAPPRAWKNLQTKSVGRVVAVAHINDAITKSVTPTYIGRLRP